MYVFCKMKYFRCFLVLKLYNFKHKFVETKLNLNFISVSQEENLGKIPLNSVSSV